MIRCACFVSLTLTLLAVGCRSAEDADPLAQQTERAAPAAAVAPAADSVGLSGQLASLEAELRAAIEAEGDGLMDRMARAEAITDRLLESEPQVAWLAQDYFTEARLRQLQVMADRVIARLRRGASFDQLEPDLDSFVRAVERLRERLASGGSAEAPPPLDSLLRDTAGYRRAPGQAAGEAGAAAGGAPAQAAPAQRGPRLLGTPVDTMPG